MRSRRAPTAPSTRAGPAITPRSCVRATRSCAAPPTCSTPAQKVAMLVGQGAKGATDEVIKTADVLGAGVARALNGRAAVPDDLAFVTGSIGLLGTKPSDDMMQGCDTLLMVGTSFPYSEWLPEPGQARGVQIDIDARKLGIRYPIEVAMVGDAAETLRALIPLPPAQGGPLLARGDRGRGRALVAPARRARPGRRQPDQPPARLPRALRTPARPRDRARRLGLGHELVRPPPAPAPRHGRRV